MSDMCHIPGPRSRHLPRCKMRRLRGLIRLHLHSECQHRRVTECPRRRHLQTGCRVIHRCRCMIRQFSNCGKRGPANTTPLRTCLLTRSQGERRPRHKGTHMANLRHSQRGQRGQRAGKTTARVGITTRTTRTIRVMGSCALKYGPRRGETRSRDTRACGIW